MTGPFHALLKHQGWEYYPHSIVFAMQILNLQYGWSKSGWDDADLPKSIGSQEDRIDIVEMGYVMAIMVLGKV